MVKIKQGDIWGRVGTSFGEGLASQVPQELEHYQKKQGLEEFKQGANKRSPLENVIEAQGIRGITPQGLQSLTDVMKRNQEMSAFNRSAGNDGGQGEGTVSKERSGANIERDQFRLNEPSQNIRDIKFGDLSNRGNQSSQPQTQMQAVRSEPGQPGIAGQNENPLAQEKFTRLPWTPQQRNARISYYGQKDFLPDQAIKLAADDEARDLAEPGALQKAEEELQLKKKGIQQELTRKIELKLQKKGDELFENVSGNDMNAIQRGAERDIRLGKTIEEATEDWSNRAHEMSKAKTQLKTLGATTGIESLFKGDQTLKKLEQYSKIYKKNGNSEEYQNLLQENFGLSPQASAYIAFPRSEGVSGEIKSYSPIHKGYGKTWDVKSIDPKSRKIASDITKKISAQDSISAIMRELSDKDPMFNQTSFIEELKSEAGNSWTPNERQERELAEGERGIISHWGDFLILPWRK